MKVKDVVKVLLKFWGFVEGKTGRVLGDLLAFVDSNWDANRAQGRGVCFWILRGSFSQRKLGGWFTDWPGVIFHKLSSSLSPPQNLHYFPSYLDLNASTSSSLRKSGDQLPEELSGLWALKVDSSPASFGKYTSLLIDGRRTNAAAAPAVSARLRVAGGQLC